MAVDLNRLLPALIPAVIALFVLGTLGLLLLNWVSSAQVRLWIKRALLLLVLLVIGGPLVYWFATWGVEGTPRHAIDRSMQQKKQDDLQKRVQTGGH
jgi:hypothetical protein